jgi:hypothetical protein
MSNKYIDWGLWDKKEAPLPDFYDPLQYLAARGTDALNADFGINNRLAFDKKKWKWGWESDPAKEAESIRRATHEVASYPAGRNLYDLFTEKSNPSYPSPYPVTLRGGAALKGIDINPQEMAAPLAGVKTQGEAYSAGRDILTRLLKGI